MRDLQRITLADLLERYEAEVTSAKRGADREHYKLKVMRAHSIAALPLAKFGPAAVCGYRDDRLKHVQGSTVRRELAVLQHCLEVARKEWGVPLSVNPVRSITLPPAARARDRRFGIDAARKLETALAATRVWYLHPLIELAVETGMRRGELLTLRWADVSVEKGTAHLPLTKNGHARTIALTPRASLILGALPRADTHVFPVSGNAVRLAWGRLRKRAGVQDLRFHDLRHEAVSRFFEMGLSIPEVALITGHRDARMLIRYTHLRPEAFAAKLARIAADRRCVSEVAEDQDG